MSTIYVKNGNWDEACATLKVNLDKREASFNAQLSAAFAPRGGCAEPAKAKATAPGTAGLRLTSSSGSALSRSLRRGGNA